MDNAASNTRSVRGATLPELDGATTVSQGHWLCIWPVLESILSHLSASDSALLLSLLGGRLHWKDWQNIVNKYVTPIRDIPEYAPWIELMINKGHTIMLMGADLDDLRQRHRYPQLYWKKGKGRHTLRIWLFARVSKEIALGLSRYQRSYWLKADGDVIFSTSTPESTKVRHSKRAWFNGTIIPIPGTSGDFNFDFGTAIPSGADIRWERSNILNDSRIDVVCAYPPRQKGVSAIQMCPVKHEERGTGSAEKRFMVHSPGSDPTDCHLLSPGAMRKPWPSLTSVGFTMPYFNVQRGTYSSTRPLPSYLDRPFAQEGDEIELDCMALKINFRCRRGASAIHEELQTVRW